MPTAADYAGARRSWRGDLLAGTTVAVVALPLALGFGEAAGLGAQAGLVTAIVAGLVAALFGGSNVQVSGPTGAMAAVLIPIIHRYGAEAIPAVGLAAGLAMLVLVVVGAGRTLAYVPWPVIEGFTAGIAAIIFLQQVPAALGVTRANLDSTVLVAADAVRSAVQHGDVVPIAVAIATILLVLGLTRLHRSIPASLAAIAVATVLVELTGAPVARIGSLVSAWPAAQLPTLPPIPVGEFLSAAVAIALLAALESLLSARVADGMSGKGRHDPDRELLGQALANLAAPLFGGMPATGAIARTAVNVRAGARTRLAAIAHAGVLLLVMLAAASLVGRIPLASLAGVLMVTAFGMVQRANVLAVLRATRSDAMVLSATALATVVFDLVIAVELGLAGAALLALRAVAQSANVRLQPVTDENGPDDADLRAEGIISYRLDGVLFFGAAQRFLDELTQDVDARVVILRLPDLRVLDATGAAALGDIVRVLERRGITVILKGARPEHARILRAVRALDQLAHENHLVTDLPAALAHARVHLQRDARAPS